MKLIDKYIIKQLIVGFCVVLFSMIMLIWLLQSLKLIDMIVTKGVSVGIFLKMTMYVLPNFIQILTPLALFAVALFVFIRMQGDKELMVMRASGMSNFQLMRPVLTFACVLMVMCYGLTLWIIPEANRDVRQMKWQVRNNLAHLLLQEGQFNNFKDGLTVYVKERLNDGRVNGILVHENKKDKISTMVAQSGIVFQEGDELQVILHNGVRQELDPQTKKFSMLKFDKYTMIFDDQKKEKLGITDAKEVSMKTLLTTKLQGDFPPRLYRRYKVEAVKRLTQPIYNITFAFLAMFILIGYYNRRGQMGQINTIVGMAVLIQSLSLAFENLATKNLMFLPLMFLNFFIPIAVGYWVVVRGRHIRFFKWTVMALMICLMSAPVHAVSVLNVKQPDVSKDKPVDFEADRISMDEKTNIMTASGNVILSQNGIVLKTDQIKFDKSKNQIEAPDTVQVTLPDGTQTTTQSMKLSADLAQALADGIMTRFYDGTTVQAEKLTRSDNGKITTLNEVMYTPCDMCEGKSPLWDLRAKEMIRNMNTQTISYWHSFFEIKDVPVFYLPYFQTPDFTVKRKTGFLTPSFSSGRELSSAVSLPFFVDIADNQNLLLTPVVSATHTPLGLLDYEGLFSRGEISFKGSATEDKDNNKEGHLKAGFHYDINEAWRASGQYFRVSNDTYFRRYVIPDVDDEQPFLESNITLERFGENSYFTGSVLGFQDLRSQSKSNEIMHAYPLVDFHYMTDPLLDGDMYAFSNANLAVVDSTSKLKSDRLSVTQGIRMPYVSPFGFSADFLAFARADGYHIDSGRDGFSGVRANDSYETGRIYPNVSLELGYPMSSQIGSVSQILEPIIMGVWAPNGGNSVKIPNTDSLDFDFDDTNLFSPNRFSGYDRVEGGARVNYGIRWSLYDTEDRSVSALFGQSYRLREDDNLNGLVGTDNHFSDYVGRLQIDYKDLSAAYRFRLKQQDLSFAKNELSVAAGRNPLRIGANYLYLTEQNSSDYAYDTREEIYLWASSQLTRQWSATGYYRYNLVNGTKPLEGGFSLRYDNECTALLFELEKSYGQDKDYKGDTTFMVKIILKTLGGK